MQVGRGTRKQRADDAGRRWTVLLNLILAVGFIMFLWIVVSTSCENMTLNNEPVYPLTDGWSVTYEGKTEDATLPTHQESKAGEKVVFTKTLRKEDGKGNSIMFHSYHQYVKIYLDGEEIFSYGEGQVKPFKMSVGSPWIHVRLPADWEGKTLQVETVSVYDEYSGMQEEIYFGTKNALVSVIYRNAMKTMMWNLPIIIMGICVIVGSFMFREKRTVRRLRYLGLTALVISGWICLESKVTQAFTGNVLVSMNLIFILFGLIPVLFSRFLLTYESFENSRYMKFAFYYSSANYVMIQILQICSVRDYMETVPAVHVAIIITILGIVFVFAGKRIKRERIKDTALVTGCLVFAVFALLDILRFYIYTPLADPILFTRMGLICFLGVLGFSALKEAAAEKEGQIEKETWKRLAVTDTLTNLPNRMSFEEHMRIFREEKQDKTPMIMVADLNNLKKINDMFGHTKGDQAIIRTAELLKKAFHSGADCFRIGGDEFCVIAEGIIPEEFRLRSEAFTRLVEEENKKTEYDFSVAYGFVEAGTEGIDEAFRRADRKMYECKLKMKETMKEG